MSQFSNPTVDKKIIRTVEAMHRLAEKIAVKLRGGDTLLLYGELGSGKTTFVQGLARALSIADPVTSPTFVIASEYGAVNHPFIKTFVHVDLYRLDSATAAGDPAVRDALECASDSGRLTVIEWADRLGAAAPAGARKITFQPGRAPNERILTFS